MFLAPYETAFKNKKLDNQLKIENNNILDNESIWTILAGSYQRNSFPHESAINPT